MTTIRGARQDEAGELASIAMRAWESAVSGWPDLNASRDNAVRAFGTFTARNYLTIDVAEKNGQIVGWAARENLDNHITDLWVEPVFQRQGIGRLLLEKIEAEVARLGYAEMLVETHAQNARAIDFLKQLGYSIKWMTARWSPQIDREVDTVGFSKPLEPGEGGQGAYSQF